MNGSVRLPADFDWDKLQVVCDPNKTIPQAIANAVAAEVSRCVEWFHNPDDVYLGDPTVRPISDEEVVQRIDGWQIEYNKEVDRYNRGQPDYNMLERYILSDMPFERQRALVERWERIWQDWFEEHPGWIYESDIGFVHEKYGHTGGPDGLAFLDGLKDVYRQEDDDYDVLYGPM